MSTSLTFYDTVLNSNNFYLSLFNKILIYTKFVKKSIKKFEFTMTHHVIIIHLVRKYTTAKIKISMMHSTRKCYNYFICIHLKIHSKTL